VDTPRPSPRTNRTRRVPHPVQRWRLTGGTFSGLTRQPCPGGACRREWGEKRARGARWKLTDGLDKVHVAALSRKQRHGAFAPPLNQHGAAGDAKGRGGQCEGTRPVVQLLEGGGAAVRVPVAAHLRSPDAFPVSCRGGRRHRATGTHGQQDPGPIPRRAPCTAHIRGRQQSRSTPIAAPARRARCARRRRARQVRLGAVRAAKQVPAGKQ
jgi:hypothetical protein